MDELNTNMNNDINNSIGVQKVLEQYGEEFFGALTPFIADINVTDINCNGRDVWINDVNKGRYKADVDFKEEDVKRLAYRVSNTENVQFNTNYPILQADLVDLRFHFTHESLSVSGTTCSIRKTPVVSRINENTMKKNEVEYLSDKANFLLKNAIINRNNTMVCGLTGSGKTELIKYLMGFTKPSERIITIEDTSELHLPEIYQDKDIVELKINAFVDYDDAIKSCMRMLPVWVLLSEARSKEVKELLKCISTGAKIISSIHTDNAKQIPKRILNMFEDNELSNDKIENMIYDYLDIGIHIRAEFGEKTVRYVDQIVYYELDSKGNRRVTEIYKVKQNIDDSYSYTYNPLPETLVEKLGKFGPEIEKGWCPENV